MNPIDGSGLQPDLSTDEDFLLRRFVVKGRQTGNSDGPGSKPCQSSLTNRNLNEKYFRVQFRRSLEMNNATFIFQVIENKIHVN